MKKLIASLTFILLFGGFALYQNGASQNQSAASSVVAISGMSAPAAKSSAATTPVSSGSGQVAAAPPPKKTVASASAPAQGQYRDGTYTGSPADAYYGTVQVQVTIANGQIAGVTFLNYPQDRGTSVRINSYAMPQLTQEAIAAQSANVNGVSGASDTSDAFRQSLSSALQQAA